METRKVCGLVRRFSRASAIVILALVSGWSSSADEGANAKRAEGPSVIEDAGVFSRAPETGELGGVFVSAQSSKIVSALKAAKSRIQRITYEGVEQSSGEGDIQFTNDPKDVGGFVLMGLDSDGEATEEMVETLHRVLEEEFALAGVTQARLEPQSPEHTRRFLRDMMDHTDDPRLRQSIADTLAYMNKADASSE